MTSSTLSSDADSVRIKDVRKLRQTADFLTRDADRHRAVLIDRLGMKRYIFNALGRAAHHPADEVELVWPEGRERVERGGIKVGHYLHRRARTERRLPQAILIDGKKYYL